MAFVGMRYVVAAKLKEHTPGQAPVYDEGVVVGRAISADITYNRATNTLKADDVDAESDNSITGGSITIGVDDIADEVQAAILAQEVNEAGEYEEINEADPDIGLGYIRVRRFKGVTSYVAYWIFKAQLGITSESAATKQDTIQWQTPTLSGSMMGLQPDASMKMKFRRRKTFTGETAEQEAYAWLNRLANITTPGQTVAE